MTSGEQITAKAFKAFDAWCRKHDGEFDSILDAVDAYFNEWQASQRPRKRPVYRLSDYPL